MVEPSADLHTLNDLMIAVNSKLKDDDERERYGIPLREFVSTVRRSSKMITCTIEQARTVLENDEEVRNALRESYEYLAPLLRDEASENKGFSYFLSLSPLFSIFLTYSLLTLISLYSIKLSVLQYCRANSGKCWTITLQRQSIH